jgi:hypothetical protein
MDYQKRIEEIGQGKKPSKKLAAVIEDYEAMNVVIADLEEEIRNEEDDEAIAEKQADLDNMLDQRKAIERELEKALKGWEAGLAKVENMRNVKKSKEAPAPVAVTPAAAAPSPTPKPVQSVVAEEVVVEKKSGYGWLVFGGIALILTLGAVNVMKEK